MVEPSAELPPLERLVAIVRCLLGPGGCPWDQSQTHESLKKSLLEEAYEVIDAIDSQDVDALREELGDLLLQPILHAEIAARNGAFDTQEVTHSINEKLIRRHPHVFGEAEANTPDEVLKTWDAVKRTEKPGRSGGLLSSVPRSMPSLLRAHELSTRAARCGFEWESIEGVFEKLEEEKQELRQAIEQGENDKMEDELGDLLFTVVNLARWTNVEPEQALRKMLDRFSHRFGEMERTASKPLEQLSSSEWNELWERAKSLEPRR